MESDIDSSFPEILPYMYVISLIRRIMTLVVVRSGWDHRRFQIKKFLAVFTRVNGFLIDHPATSIFLVTKKNALQ